MSINHGGPLLALHQMGYFPPGFAEAARSLGLTCILFLGPLFEAGIADGAWRDWLRLRDIGATLGSWTGYRDLIAVSHPEYVHIL